MLKLLDPISVFVPRFVRNVIGLPPRPNLGCVIRPGGLGDLVLATMAFIEAGFDPWRVVWIVEKRNKSWCEYLKLPYLCYNQAQGLLLAARSREGYEWVIDTEQSYGLSSCFACRLTSPNNKIIGYYKKRGLNLIDNHLSVDRSSSHEKCSFIELFKFAALHVKLPSLVHNPLDEIVGPAIEGKNCVVAIGGRQSKERAFSLDDWKKIINYCNTQSLSVILVGDNVDTKFSVELMVTCPHIYFNYVGRIRFDETVRLIREAELVVGVDSGLIHVASFFQKKTTAVFAERAKIVRWAPLANTSKSLLIDDIRVMYG